MNKLMAGFARANITPPKGIAINGYFKDRKVEGYCDLLIANCIALSCDDKTALLLSLDNLGIPMVCLEPMVAAICEATTLPRDAVFIHCTHTHTGAAIGENWDGPLELHYRERLTSVLAQLALDALISREPARMGWRTITVPNLAFSRRFRMKDGSVRTNPGIGNPDISHPLGTPDDQLRMLRFDRESGDSLVLLSFGMHPDSVGGNLVSSDWPGFVRRTFERTIPNAIVSFFNGAEGDIGVQNVFPQPGDMNGLELDFDDVYRGYDATERYGRILAGAALQIYDVVAYTDVETLSFARRPVQVPAQVPAPQELPLARKYAKLHNDGHDDQIPYTGMQLTTVVAEALRMVRLEKGPEFFSMELSGLAIGPVALVGIPGEPFAGVSLGLQDPEQWGTVFVTCNTNGYEGYFPMQEAYDEGGYEARSSNFRPGVAELLIREGHQLLKTLKER